MARYVCKNLVASGVCRRAELQVAYAIGMAHPVSLFVDTFGTGVISDEKLTALVKELFDFRPMAIIRTLGLDKPIFRETSNYGHFGRDEFSWEKTDRADDIREAVKKYQF